jgi:hypothetical protein
VLKKGGAERLTGARVAVYTIKSTGTLPAQYQSLHVKYLIADGSQTLVLSENFKPTGIPLPGTRGNHRWDVVVGSTGVAEYFRDVFTANTEGYDISAYMPGTELLPESWSDDVITVHCPVRKIYNVSVAPIISPDTSCLIPALIQDADEKIDLQQTYISSYPGMRTIFG